MKIFKRRIQKKIIEKYKSENEEKKEYFNKSFKKIKL